LVHDRPSAEEQTSTSLVLLLAMKDTQSLFKKAMSEGEVPALAVWLTLGAGRAFLPARYVGG
jgi:hypothetical protein